MLLSCHMELSVFHSRTWQMPFGVHISFTLFLVGYYKQKISRMPKELPFVPSVTPLVNPALHWPVEVLIDGAHCPPGVGGRFYSLPPLGGWPLPVGHSGPRLGWKESSRIASVTFNNTLCAWGPELHGLIEAGLTTQTLHCPVLPGSTQHPPHLHTAEKAIPLK